MSPGEAGAFHRQWNDLRVGRFLWDGKPVTPDTVEAVIASSTADFARHGFGLWSASVVAGGSVRDPRPGKSCWSTPSSEATIPAR
jgi:hypothetical protein